MMFRYKIINIVKNLYNRNVFFNNSNSIATSAVNNRDVVDRKEMLRSLPALDEGTIGETGVDIDSMFRK